MSRRQCLRNLCIAMLFVLFGLRSTATAQSKEEVHAFFFKTAAEMNAKRAQYSTPLIQFIRVEYDRSTSMLTYRYSTSVLRDSGRSKFSREEMTLTQTQLADTGCRSLGAFMRLHDLQLVHIYFDSVGGSEIARFRITKRDCNK